MDFLCYHGWTLFGVNSKKRIRMEKLLISSTLKPNNKVLTSEDVK